MSKPFIYQMPDDSWACAYSGEIWIGFETREDAEGWGDRKALAGSRRLVENVARMDQDQGED